MNKGMFTLSAITALGLALLPSSIVAQQKSLKEQLVGTWTLTKSQPLGANPKGILIFDAGGRYTRIAGKSDRPKLKSEVTPQEFGAAVLGSFGANFGTWSVNEADKTLIVRVEGAQNPNLEGAERKDKISLVGDELRVQGPDPGQDETVWQCGSEPSDSHKGHYISGPAWLALSGVASIVKMASRPPMSPSGHGR